MAMTAAEKEAFKKRMAEGRAKAKASGATPKKATAKKTTKAKPKKKATTKKATTVKKKTAAKKKSAAKKKVAAKKKPAKRVAKAKTPKVKKPRAAPSAKQKAIRSNFSAATSLAVDLIYDAGKAGAAKPTWGRAVRAAYGSGALAGTARKKKPAAKRKRTTKKK